MPVAGRRRAQRPRRQHVRVADDLAGRAQAVVAGLGDLERAQLGRQPLELARVVAPHRDPVGGVGDRDDAVGLPVLDDVVVGVEERDPDQETQAGQVLAPAVPRRPELGVADEPGCLVVGHRAMRRRGRRARRRTGLWRRVGADCGSEGCDAEAARSAAAARSQRSRRSRARC
jgi:hypothetical protein